jgi:hypothetical protein
MTKTGIHNLSQRDACCILELIQESLACHNLDVFRGLMAKLKSLVAYDFTTCLVCKKGKGGQIQSLDVVNINYPSEWVELYVARNYQQIDPVLKENFESFRIQYWADTYRKMSPPKVFLSLAEGFGLARGYTYGVRSFTGEEGACSPFRQDRRALASALQQYRCLHTSSPSGIVPSRKVRKYPNRRWTLAREGSTEVDDAGEEYLDIS